MNKVNSKATLRWPYAESPDLPDDVKSRFGKLFAKRINDLGELVLSSSRHREQRRNIDDCLAKLRHLIQAAAIPPRVRKRPKKSAAATRRRLQEKREQSDRKKNRRSPKWDD